MSIADDIQKAIDEKKKQQQQTSGDDGSTVSKIQEAIDKKKGKISASKSLTDSLEGVEHNTALSSGMIGEYRDKATNFFDNAWHTITDKDEEHGIKDYSQYKLYKNALDNAEPNQDVDAIYQQMAKENVIDYNKFSSWVNSEDYKKKNEDKYDNYNKAVDNIKQGLSDKLDAALTTYMPTVDDGSYQLNALTKAKSEMLDQASMFIDSYAETYKSTRDKDLLKDFDKIWDEYQNDVVNFTKEWAQNLTSKDESAITAYYDTDKSYLKGIRKLQYQAENKQTLAALKSNFGDSRDAFSKGEVVSGTAELVGGGMNAVNWLLDKVGNVVEYTKNATIGWYDVGEELTHLNVYSNNAGYMEKTFGTMASWAGEIVDAAPTLVPMIVDFLVGSKTGATTMLSKGDDIIPLARKIDDIVGLIYKNKNNISNIKKAEDLATNLQYAANLGSFGIKYLSEGLQNIFLFDIMFQQFENRPLTDEDLTTNFLMNLPLDSIAAMFTQAPKIIAKDLKGIKGFEEVFKSDTIDKDLYNLLKKHYQANKKAIEAGGTQAESALKQAQEKFYMYNSMKARQGAPMIGKNTVTLGEDVIDEFIKKSRNGAEGVYERLSSFGGSLDEYLLDIQTRIGKKKASKMSMQEAVENEFENYVRKTDVFKTGQSLAIAHQNISQITEWINNGSVKPDYFVNVVNKTLGDESVIGEKIKAIFTGTNAEFKKLYDSGVEDTSREEVSDALNKIVTALVNDNIGLISSGDTISGYIKTADGRFFNPATGETLQSFEELKRVVGGEISYGGTQAKAVKQQIDNINNSISLGKLKSDEDGLFDVTDYLDDFNINGYAKLDKSNYKDYKVVKAYEDRGFKVVQMEDGTTRIKASLDNIRKLRDDIESIRNIKGKTEISSDQLSAFKFVFRKEINEQTQRSIDAANNFKRAAGQSELNETEKKIYVENSTTAIEDSFESATKEVDDNVKKIKDNNPNMSTKEAESRDKGVKTRKGELENKKTLKGNENVANDMSEAIDGNKNFNEVEKTAIGEKLKSLMNVSNLYQIIREREDDMIADSTERLITNRKDIRTAFKDLFITRIFGSTLEAPKDIDVIDRVSNKMGSIVEASLANNDSGEVIELLTKTFSNLYITPKTLSTLDADNDLLELMLSKALSKDTKTSYVFFNNVADKFKTAIANSKNSKEKLDNSNVYGSIVNMMEGISYVANMGTIDESVVQPIIKKLVSVVGCDDYWEFVKLIENNESELNKINYIINKGITIGSNTSKGRIEEIARSFALNAVYDNRYYSMKLYNDLVNGFIKGFDTIKKDIGDLDIHINIGKHVDGLYFGVKESGNKLSKFINLNVLSAPYILGAINNGETFMQNVLMHETGHGKLQLTKTANKYEYVGEIDRLYRGVEDEKLQLSFVDYVKNLKKHREEVIIGAGKDNKESALYLDNYMRFNDVDKHLDNIISRFNKGKLVDSLVGIWDNEGKIDRDYKNLSYINKRLLGDFEEYINELNVYAALGQLDSKDLKEAIDINKVNKALSLMEECAEVVDRFRYISMKSEEGIDEYSMRNILNAAFDIERTTNNNNLGNEVMNIIYNSALSKGGKDVNISKEVDNMRVVLGIAAKDANEFDSIINTKGSTSKNVFDLFDNKAKGVDKQNIDKLRKNIIRNLGLLKGNNNSPLSDKQIDTLLSLAQSKDKTQFSLMLSYMDIYNYVPDIHKMQTIDEGGLSHIVDAEYIDTGSSEIDKQVREAKKEFEDMDFDGSIATSKTTKYDNKNESIVMNSDNQTVSVSSKGNKRAAYNGRVKGTESLVGVSGDAIKELGKLGMNKRTALIGTLSTMGHDLGVFGTDVLSILSQLVGNRDLTISKDLLLIGGDVEEAFVKSGETNRTLFYINRIVANVLSNEKKYSKKTIDIINKNLEISQIDEAINQTMGDTDKIFRNMFDNIKKEFGVSEGYGKLFTKDDVIGSEALLTKKQWEDAKDEWLKDKTKTIGKFYDFGRGEITFNGRTLDLENSYDDYKYYREQRENLGYNQFRAKEGGIDTNKVIKNIHPAQMRMFNNAVVEYLNARKLGNGVLTEQSIKKVNRKFRDIIDDVGSWKKLNFKFSSISNPEDVIVKEGEELDSYVKEAKEIIDSYGIYKEGTSAEDKKEGMKKIKELINKNNKLKEKNKEITESNIKKHKEKRLGEISTLEGSDIKKKPSGLDRLSSISLYDNKDESVEQAWNEVYEQRVKEAENKTLGDEVMSLDDLATLEELEDLKLTDDYYTEFGQSTTSSYISEAGSALNDTIESFVNNELYEGLKSPYQLKYNPDMYRIKETNPGNYTINLGAHYNSLKDKAKANEFITNKFTEYKNGDFERDSMYTIWGRLQSFANGSFVDGNMLKLGTVYGVDSIFGKVLNDKVIRGVQVVFNNGHSMMYTKDGLEFTRGGDALGIMSDITNSMLRDKGGLTVRYVDKNNTVLSQHYFMSDDIWRSYVGHDLIKQIGLSEKEYVPNLPSMSLDFLSKNIGNVSVKNGTKLAEYKDVFSLAAAYGSQGLGYSNENIFVGISTRLANRVRALSKDGAIIREEVDNLNKELRKAKATNDIHGANEISDKIKKLESDYDKIRNKTNEISRTKSYIDNRMKIRGFETSSQSVQDVERYSQLRLDGEDIRYDENGNVVSNRVKDEDAYVRVITETEGSPVKEVTFERMIKNVNDYENKSVKRQINYNKIVRKDVDGNIIEEKPLHNYYTVVGIKPKMDIIDDDKGYLTSVFLEQGNKGSVGIPLERLRDASVSSHGTRYSIDNKMIEEYYPEASGKRAVVNNDDGEVILCMVDDTGHKIEVGLKKTMGIFKEDGSQYPAYRLLFNGDSGDLGKLLPNDNKRAEYLATDNAKIKEELSDKSNEIGLEKANEMGDELYDYELNLTYSNGRFYKSKDALEDNPTGWKLLGDYFEDYILSDTAKKILKDSEERKTNELIKIRRGDRTVKYKKNADKMGFSKDTIIGALNKEDKEVINVTKKADDELKDITEKMYNMSDHVSSIFAATNYDLMGGSTLISQIMGANSNFKRVFGNRLKDAVKIVDNNIWTLSEQEQKELFKNISTACNRSKDGLLDYVFANPKNKAEEGINEIAKIFKEANWKGANIMNNINSINSFDNLLQNTFNSYNNAAISLLGLKNKKEVRELIQAHALKLGADAKRAENFAKDFVGDPLGTGKMMSFMANIRSAYRFAKYSLLSPISGTIMYLNSLIMSEPLLKSKKAGLSLYYNNESFKKLIGEKGVTDWLERDEDIIYQGFNGMQMNGLRVDKQLQKLADLLGKPFGEETRKKINAATMGGIHSVYDMQRSGEVRVYAFAQALKQNGVVTDAQLADLLKKISTEDVENGVFVNSATWRKIMADTEINYGRFFTNANTSALSRHRRSRAYGFNFLQGYVINRADEMAQGIRKLYNFVNEAGVRNLTRDDVTRHLAEDNVEMKAFINNIILSAKMGYYLDKVDGDDKKNMREYFIDTNDYLSSLNTTFFMRLLTAPYRGYSNYREYADFAKTNPTMIGGVSSAAYQLTSELCSMFFREGKFLNAMVNTLVAGMQTGDLNFAATVAGVEREKMANGLGRFGLVDGIETYGLEDLSETSDIIGQLLLNGNKTTKAGEIKSKIYDISQIDSIINDPSYATVTAFGYLPVVGEMLKSVTGNGGYGFSEAKYKEMMDMVENDGNLKELYKGSLNTELYTNESINRLRSDFTSFNYPSKSLKDIGKHSVGSFSEGKDITLSSMKEDVFVQNMCEKLGMSIEEFHKYITADYSNNAKKTGLMKIMAASEAAEPGSGKIVLSYIMSNALYQLEKKVTQTQYPTAADVGEENMNELKRIVLEQYGDLMFTADKTSWYKAIREYISIANPSVFKTLYKNETLNGYVSSIGFMDSLMRDASQKGDVDAKYIKNAFSVLTKYMKDDTARTTAVEYLFNEVDKLDMPEGVRRMTMEGILAGNIDFYNHLKNSVVLSTLYKDALDSFEHRVRGTLQTDVYDDSYRTQKKSYGNRNYGSNYGNNNGQVEDNLKDKANKYFPKSSGNGTTSGYVPKSSYTTSSPTKGSVLDWNWNYYAGLIKEYSDMLVKSKAKAYPGDRQQSFLSREENKGDIKGSKLYFKKHKQPKYSTSVMSNMPGSRG